MNGGYIKLYRRMMEWEWYQDANTKSVFLHLLLSANHKQKKWQGIEVKPGQTITSLSKLSEQLGMGIQSVRTAIRKLEETNEVTCTSTNRYSLVTLVKWGDYQGQDDDTNTPTNKQLTSRKQPFFDLSTSEVEKINTQTNTQKNTANPVADRGTESDTQATNTQTNKQLTFNQQATNKQLTTNKNDKECKNDITNKEPFVSIILKNGTYHHVYPADVDRYKSTYSLIDVEYHLKDIAEWNKANPLSRKTPSGVSRHIRGWLSDKQEQAMGIKPKKSYSSNAPQKTKAQLQYDESMRILEEIANG